MSDQPPDPTDEPRSPSVDAPEPDDEEFDRRGWLLVAVVVFAFVVAPGLILLNPPALPFEVAFLVLPLLPAVLLGATAVWVALRRGETE